MSTLGVKDGTVPQLETSPPRMMMIGTNFRGDEINTNEMILGSMGYSLVWVVDEGDALPANSMTITRLGKQSSF